MIGIALRGVGYAARIQLACWREIPGSAAIGIWNRSAERARALAAEFGVPSFDELDPLQKFWTGRREKVTDDSFAPSAMIPASPWGHVLSQRERVDERERAAERGIPMDRDGRLRDHLVEMLRVGNAHMPFAEAVAQFPEAQINTRPPRVDYTFWHLLEHLRITQADILAYLMQADYHAPAWPRDYWPARDTRATKHEWDGSVAAFQCDLEAIVSIVADDRTDLFGTVPSHDEHTVLREVLIVADHNAYHIGELGILRQVTKAWNRRHSIE